MQYEFLGNLKIKHRKMINEIESLIDQIGSTDDLLEMLGRLNANLAYLEKIKKYNDESFFDTGISRVMIGDMLGISRGRVMQIEYSALKKIRSLKSRKILQEYKYTEEENFPVLSSIKEIQLSRFQMQLDKMYN